MPKQSPIPPWRTPVFDKGGNMYREWQRYFQLVFKSASAREEDDILAAFSEASVSVSRLEEIESRLAFLDNPNDSSISDIRILVDVIASRPSATPYFVGTLFWATDQTVLYQVQIVTGTKTWVFISGTMRGTINPDQKPTLGTADEDFRFFSTDFNHTFRWSGSAWAMGPDETPQGAIVPFVVAPGTGWQVCDGSTVTGSTAVGGTASVTVPNFGTAAYLKLGSSTTIGPTAASGASANASTGLSLNAHTVTNIADTGSGTNVHTGPSSHTITDPQHNHAAGTLELRRTQIAAYYRL